MKKILFPLWRKKQIRIPSNNLFLGRPIITNFKNSEVTFGQNCLVISRPQDTALGVSRPSIIRTLWENSIINIGNNVRMSGITICAKESITIGDNCVIGADVLIADTDFHSLNYAERSGKLDFEKALSKPVKIGSNVFIGGRSIILKGVELKDNVIVGAGSVVTKSFEANSIIGGNPAVIIKRIQ